MTFKLENVDDARNGLGPLASIQAIGSGEEVQILFDAKIAIQGKFLRHVAERLTRLRAGGAKIMAGNAAFALLWMDGLFPMPPWLEDFIGYLWLVIFPEAFINGMLVTALVVFYPDWLETFNRTRYLAAPWKDDDPQR